MLRLSRMTDYAVVILNHMSTERGKNQNTTGVAQATNLPSPTVSKILNRLSEAGVLKAIRGRFGGYRLDRSPSEISLGELLNAFEGPLALTDCLDSSNAMCEHVSHCAVAGRWSVVSSAISNALDGLTLEDLVLSNKVVPSEVVMAPDSIL